jgi:hypothetical protein
MPRATTMTQTAATADLYAELGHPHTTSHHGTTMMVFEVDPRGDGIIAARLSKSDLQGGETAMGQVHGLRDLARRLELTPRKIVVTVNNGGAKDYEDRPDFALIEQEILGGKVRWVGWRDPDRISRDELSFFMFLKLLKRSESTLYLSSIGRAVDWTNDRFQLSVQNAAAADERERIYLRTHEPLHNRWVAEGRGWPASGGFGFRRNKQTKFLEIDPDQWGYVEMAFYTYLELDPKDGKAGFAGVAEVLAAAGCKLTKERWRQILKNPIYVTGEFCIRRKGELISCEPIDLEGRGIPADVFQRIQELSALRAGKEDRNPVGTFIYNGISYCGTCEQKLHARFVKGSDRASYRHASPVPDSCRGRVFDAALVESSGIREILRLHSCKELQTSWSNRPQIELTDGAPLMTAEQIANARKRIAALQESKKHLIRDFNQRLVDQHASGGAGRTSAVKADEGMFRQMIAGVDDEINEYEVKIERAKTLNQVRQASLELRTESESLLDAMRELLPEEMPEDRLLRAKRAALVKTLISKVVLTEQSDATITIELHGPLVPEDEAATFNVVAHANGAVADPQLTDDERAVEVLKSRLSDSVGRDGKGTAVGTTHVLRTGEEGSPYSSVWSKPLPPLGARTQARSRRPGAELNAPAWQSPGLEVGPQRPRVMSRFAPESLRRLAELLTEGNSVSASARVLEAEGMPTPNGGRWKDSVWFAVCGLVENHDLDLDPATLAAVAEKVPTYRALPRRRRYLTAVTSEAS